MSSVYDATLSRLIMPSASSVRKVFVAGKGGVGKTTMACAAAWLAAEQGFRTALVTTDPAAHIGRLFGVPIGAELTPFGTMPLWLARIDPKAALQSYQQAVLATVPDDPMTRARVQEELQSPCTEEVAVFQHFLDFVLDDTFDVTVFDTAPTGHTVRLLQLAWDYVGELNTHEALSQETAALDETQLLRMQKAIHMLTDSDHTSMIFVTLPEATPIVEMERAIEDLAHTGIASQAIVVNQVLPEESATSPLFAKRFATQRDYLVELQRRHPMVEITSIPWQEEEITGAEPIRQIAQLLR